MAGGRTSRVGAGVPEHLLSDEFFKWCGVAKQGEASGVRGKKRELRGQSECHGGHTLWFFLHR